MESGSGLVAKAQNAVVTSSNMFHVFHIVFFPRPAKHDTVSHPLNACIKAGFHRGGGGGGEPWDIPPQKKISPPKDFAHSII